MRLLILILAASIGIGFGQIPKGGGGGTPASGPGSGTVTSIVAGCGLSGGTITASGTIANSITVTVHNGSYTILTGDCGNSITSNVAAAWTLPQAGSAGFAAGWSIFASNIGATGNVVITTTTSTFYGNGGTGSTETLTPGTAVRLVSDGTNWQVFYTSSPGATLGKNTFTGTQTMAVNTVASGATPAFDLSLGNIQYVSALAINAAPTLSNITTGGIWTWVICNNGVGNFTWTWPAAVHGGMTIGVTASKCSSQTFTSPDGSTLYANSTGNINQ